MSVVNARQTSDSALAWLADRTTERTVLVEVLAAHPRPVSAADIVERCGQRFAAEAVDRALATLTEAGLLLRKGDAVVPDPVVVRVAA